MAITADEVGNDLALVIAVMQLMYTAGKALIDMLPVVNMFFQILEGTPLTPEQRADLQARYKEQTDAALAPLTPPTPDEANG